MKVSTIIFLVFLVLLLFSCNNDDDSVDEGDRSQALLGQWEYESIMTDTAVDINGDGTVNIDLFNTQEIRQCIKDNLTFFTEMEIKGAGAYAINENGLACDDQDPFSTIDDDNYELFNNTTIRFDNRNEMRIIELTKTKLVVEMDDNLGNEDVVVTISYNKS